MLDKKYYTPDPEDLFIGYECEEVYNKHGDWCKSMPVVDGICIDNLIDGIKGRTGYSSKPEIRTKYLDKEDILSLGWILTGEELKTYSHWCNFQTKDWNLSVQLNDKYFPRLLNLRALKHCSWKGNIKIECKSINELRKIMKFINIK